MPEARLEYLFSYVVDLALPPEVIGPVAEGVRVNFYITGGRVTGPRLRGVVQPVGGDWLLLRRDGVGRVDVRATLRTDDGAVIYGAYPGIIDVGEDGYERFLAGDLPARFPIRTAPVFQTADARYAWLNRLQCLNIGHVDLPEGRVSYDVFAAV